MKRIANRQRHAQRRWLRRALLSVPLLLGTTSAPISAATVGDELVEALKTKSCGNADEVARLFIRYEKSLGESKPESGLIEDVAARLAICHGELSRDSARILAECRAKNCSGGCPGAVIMRVGLVDKLGNNNDLQFVQAVESLVLLNRDLNRVASPEIQSLMRQYRTWKAVDIVSNAASAIRNSHISAQQLEKHRVILEKPLEARSKEDNELLFQVNKWNDYLR